eukprot:767465-Hanusia_phi.AAC.2
MEGGRRGRGWEEGWPRNALTRLQAGDDFIRVFSRCEEKEKEKVEWELIAEAPAAHQGDVNCAKYEEEGEDWEGEGGGRAGAGAIGSGGGREGELELTMLQVEAWRRRAAAACVRRRRRSDCFVGV